MQQEVQAHWSTSSRGFFLLYKIYKSVPNFRCRLMFLSLFKSVVLEGLIKCFQNLEMVLLCSVFLFLLIHLISFCQLIQNLKFWLSFMLSKECFLVLSLCVYISYREYILNLEQFRGKYSTFRFYSSFHLRFCNWDQTNISQ